MCVLMWGLYTTAAVLWNIYVQCGNLICLMLYFKYVCSVPCNMLCSSDFICGTYMWIHLPYKSIKYLAYISNLMDIFVSDTHLAITWDIYIAVGCDLAHICKKCGSIYPLNMLAVWHTFAMSQSYLFSVIWQICMQWHWELPFGDGTGREA